MLPMPGSLCMGFSWSLFFCQRINERVMAQAPRLLDSEASEAVTDRGAPVVLKPGSPEAVRHVDNLGVLSGGQAVVEESLSHLTELFTSKNPSLHPAEIQSERVKTLGVELNGEKLCTRMLPDRLHKLRASIRGLIRRGRCSGKSRNIVIGHATFCGPVERRVLSIFHSVYKFISKCYDQVTPLWQSVRDELRVFAALVPALESDWTRSWNLVVMASDASEDGYSIVSGEFSKCAVASVGRVTERSRFKRTSGHNARESALTAAGVKDGIRDQWIEGDLEDEGYLQASGWEIDSGFAEVPASMLHRRLWTPKVSGRWRKSEHIIHLEARALVKSLQRVADTKYGFGIR